MNKLSRIPSGLRFLTGSILIAMMISCSENPVSDQDQICEPGPYFTHLPVDRKAIASFNVIGQFNPPGDIAPTARPACSSIAAI